MEATVNKFNNVQYWFREYLKDHATAGCVKTHYIGVPTVTISLLGMLDHWINIPYANAAIGGGLILLVLSFLWYVVLDKKLALLIAPALVATYYLSTLISFEAHIGLHIFGWVFQLVGHYKYEGRSPAFFKSLPQLLIGPFFIFAKAIKYDWKK